MNADARLAALRRRLDEEQLPALLVTDVANLRYVTGFEGVIDAGINAACLVSSDFARFYTDSRYREAAENAAAGTEWTVHVSRESIYVEMATALREEGVETLAVESSIAYGRFRYISEQFGGDVRIVDALVEHLRQVKDAEEISRIAAAAALTDRAFEHILPYIRAGVSEREIALELEFFMRRNGSDGVAFDPIVASGTNSCRPHAQVTDRVVEQGDFVKLDFGARVDDYCADMTRTVVVGEASERQREIYDAVLAANLAALDAVRPGLTGVALHQVAVDVLEQRGLHEHFGHGLGHGVGLDVHELPHVGPSGRESILTGSIITIEPGVYLAGFCGVRIEDLVVVEESGARLLSHTRKELIEL